MQRLPDDSLLRRVHALAQALSSSTQLSFDERSALLFSRESKLTIHHTREAYRELKKRATNTQQSTQGIESLLDNFPYIVESALSELLEEWASKETMRIPQSRDEVGKRYPRAYNIARALIEETRGVVDREVVVEFLEIYQRQAPLSVRELDIFPNMVRYVLAEAVLLVIEATLATFAEVEDAERWFVRILAIIKKKEHTLALTNVTTQLAELYKIIPIHFSSHLLQRISQSGRERDLRIVSKWLKLTLARQGEGHVHLADQITWLERKRASDINAFISSLRWLVQMRWDKISTSLNAVDRMLARDPMGAFAGLSDETRGLYRRTVVRIADRTGVHDVEVAREAVRLARAQRDEKTKLALRRSSHVGYFLIDEGVTLLERMLGYRPTISLRIERYILAHATGAYLGGIAVITAILATTLIVLVSDVFSTPVVSVIAILMGVLLASEVANALMHYFFAQLLPPRPLARTEFSLGIGAERRTVVVVPSIFRNSASTKRLLEKLESNFIANKDDDIFFAALMDFRDAKEGVMPDDSKRVEEFENGIAMLNERYPSSIPRFQMFYRERRYNPSEGINMGWERKRGKLREFNQLLRGKVTSYKGEAHQYASQYGVVRYILTIDEDTELVADSARALVGTIEHPLNRPVIDKKRNVVTHGYGIIQPRTALRFREGSTSIFARLFGNFPGIETYSALTSDLHQDLFGEGIFHGKGLYDIDVVETTMEGRIPDNTVLSHDLLEGLYARVGSASDAFIFERFPANYLEYSERTHRWIRGDWQIGKWLSKKRGGVFSVIGRFRIFDNLRRSLLPLALVSAVLLTLFYPQTSMLGIAALAALASGQLLPVLIRVARAGVTLRKRISLRYRLQFIANEIAVAVFKMILLGVFALNNAFIITDAIIRSLTRMFITKKGLLQWQSAYDTSLQLRRGVLDFISFMRKSVSTALVLFIITLIPVFSQTALTFAWALSWLSAPLVAELISYRWDKKKKQLGKKEERYLRQIAARTYWFFIDMATKEEQWLIPDHYQEKPSRKRHSHGIGLSPTNLGMYLVSLSLAPSLGLSTLHQLAERMDKAFYSMSKLELFHGHFFNWYELKRLTPLAPKYISSVDSANLALSLLTVRGAMHEAVTLPLFSEGVFKGLDSSLTVLLDACKAALHTDRQLRPQRKLLEELIDSVSASRSLISDALSKVITPRSCEAVFSGIVHQSVRAKNALETLRIEGASVSFDEIYFIARHIESETIAFQELVGMYVGYALVPAISSVTNDPALYELYILLSGVMQDTPNLTTLALGNKRREIEKIGMLEAIELSGIALLEKDKAIAWYKEVHTRITEAEANAKICRDKLLSVASACRVYFSDMDFSFLYDPERGLFHSGYSAMNRKLDEAFYDILASEANSASIVGVSKGEVPLKHWKYLGRKLIRSKTGSVLTASWAGSLFEYLGTLIYFDVHKESFWGISAQYAIEAHQHFAKRLNIPWGMAESASAVFDIEQNYHYQAFGEPSIGYKREISQFVVVSPYATALALPFDPQAALKNFHALDASGGAGRYGFYDAIDYTGITPYKRAPGIAAKIYFAHHQGFILSSIANVVLDGWTRRMIATEPEMVVATQLFEEKMPRLPSATTLFIDKTTNVSRAPISRGENSPRQHIPVRGKEPILRFLSNGAHHVRLTSTGAGYSMRESIHLTSAAEALSTENEGTFFYLFDHERNALWSPTYMPTRNLGERSAVLAGEEVVVFEKQNEGISSSLAVTVAPDADVEIRELTLHNTRDEFASLRLGVCADVSLMDGTEEASHPNYGKLFVSSETVWDGKAIIASRPDSRNREHVIAVGALLLSSQGLIDHYPIRSREAFYGSPLYRDAPQVMRNVARAKMQFPEYALDTALGFVVSLVLKPNEIRRISFVMASGNSKDAVMSVLKPYRNEHIAHKAVLKADRVGGRALSLLGISSQQGELFASLGSLLTTRARYAGKPTAIGSAPSIGALWKCGISGTRPVLLVSVWGVAHIPMVRQILLCRMYFLNKGIEADMVIFNEHSSGYLKTFEDEIDFLLRTQQDVRKVWSSQVVHVRGEQFTEVERQSLRAVATVHIDCEKQTLADAMNTLVRVPALQLPPHQNIDPEVMHAKHRHIPTDNLEKELILANAYGGYDKESREYVIRIKKGKTPPVPWSNIISNGHLGFIATDRGMTFTWARNSNENKLTVAYNDALSSLTGEAFYVRDEASGELWCPQPMLGSAKAEYEVCHGEGYTSYKTSQGGLALTLRMFVAPHDPIKYISLTIRNASKEERRLMTFGYFEILLGTTPRETRKIFSFDVRGDKSIVVEQSFRRNFSQSCAIVGIAGGADSFSLSKEEFLGRQGDMRVPAAALRTELSSSLPPRTEPCIALAKSVILLHGEEKTVTFYIGEGETERVIEDALLFANSAVSVDKAEKDLQSYWQDIPRITIETPDESLDVLFNRFLLYQTQIARINARMGFYQIGGAYGFRDQLQDALAMLWLDPAWVRVYILTAARHQFREGDVLSWWHEHNNFGARTRLSDPHLWLPYVVCRYINFTGDAGILLELIPFLEGAIPDNADRPTVVGFFAPSQETGTLYEHCVRAIEHGLTSGSRGLALMGTADWNDGMNQVGSEGVGESVWLTWMMIDVLTSMADLVEENSDTDRARRYREHIVRYREALAQYGWDGKWYRRAYTDRGIPIGTASAKEFRIDSVTQSWAFFVDGKTERTMQALRSAKDELHILEGQVPLAWPPSTRAVLDLGTISDYPRGVRENGAQYNHAALWLAQAMFSSGDADTGKLIVDAVSPFKRSATPAGVERYRGEPYAVAAEVYSEPTFAGRAGWTWYTASSGVFYRTILEYMFGMKRAGNTISFTPSFPSDWHDAKVHVPYGKSVYHIHFTINGKPETKMTTISVDGLKSARGTLKLIDDGRAYEIKVECGNDTIKND